MPSGYDITIAGMVLLAVNLLSRHIEALHSDELIFVTGWIGSILIVVGIGKRFFLEGD